MKVLIPTFNAPNVIRLCLLIVFSLTVASCGEQSELQRHTSDSGPPKLEDQGTGDIESDLRDEDLSEVMPERRSFQEIQDSVFTPYCASCHNRPGAPPDLRDGFSYDAILGVEARQFSLMKYVSPGSSSDSWLFRKMEGTQNAPCIEAGRDVNFCAKLPMPPPFSDLSVPKPDIDAVRYWIDSGAKR